MITSIDIVNSFQKADPEMYLNIIACATNSVSYLSVENLCFMNPCLNGGTCMEALGTHTCMCLEGFSGSACESKYYYFSKLFLLYLFFYLISHNRPPSKIP